MSNPILSLIFIIQRVVSYILYRPKRLLEDHSNLGTISCNEGRQVFPPTPRITEEFRVKSPLQVRFWKKYLQENWTLKKSKKFQLNTCFFDVSREKVFRNFQIVLTDLQVPGLLLGTTEDSLLNYTSQVCLNPQMLTYNAIGFSKWDIYKVKSLLYLVSRCILR